MLTVTVWYLVFVERLVPDYLADTAFLAIVFYFGARSTEEGTGAAPRQPLYLPRGFVRGLIVAGTLGIYAYIWFLGRQIPEILRTIVDLFVGYVIGVAVSATVRATSRRARPGALAAFGHARALLCLAGVGLLCLAAVTEQHAAVPAVYITVLHMLVAFYFGSRAVG